MSGRETKPFAAVRIVSSKKRFNDQFGFVPVEGMWVELSIEPGRSRRPVTYYSPLEEDGYSRQARGTLRFARPIIFPGEGPFRPVGVGASIAHSTKLAAKLATMTFPSNSIVSAARARAQLTALSDTAGILIRDVGQASFVSLVDRAGETIAHFDAGWPISFNGHTCPSAAPIIQDGAPVILSHWDWDHLHAYYRCNTLRQVPWIVPVQQLGPGAFRVAQQLHNAGLLLGYKGSTILAPWWALVPCKGPTGPNDNGLALVVMLESGRVALLVGDAAYQSMGSPWTSCAYDFLVVTHHGADFHGPPPRPSGAGRVGVISVGQGNVYRHPRGAALSKHRAVRWKLRRTAEYRRKSRGDRLLGP
jgi:competence protein ComEC